MNYPLRISVFFGLVAALAVAQQTAPPPQPAGRGAGRGAPAPSAITAKPEELARIKEKTEQIEALVKDLKARGLLDETLVIWGGEFGRTPFLQGNLNDRPKWGRDHHPYAFTLWMAGGGVKSGITYGESDEFGMSVAKDPVHVHDFQATLLHLLGIDHERLTFKFQGRYFRLTDVHGQVIAKILA